jgi:hypothetical protein
MSGWNYRLVRRKHIDTLHDKERISYSYSVHEAFYDKLGKVILISAEPEAPYGENVTEVRRSYAMMAEAFGKPILDYDKIPEEGFDEDNALVSGKLLEDLSKLALEPEESEDTEESDDELSKLPPFDSEAFEKECEEDRLKSEVIHNEKFVDVHPFNKLVESIVNDYITRNDKKE